MPGVDRDHRSHSVERPNFDGSSRGRRDDDRGLRRRATEVKDP
jgi:hypothetical protein